jgi:hypothetical protein
MEWTLGPVEGRCCREFRIQKWCEAFMRILALPTLLPALLLLGVAISAGQNKSLPTIPQTFPPPEPDHPHLQIDQPPTVVHGNRRAAPNAARAKQDADQLAKLAASIPTDVDKVAKGEMPLDLDTRLKRIEKLSKQLRRDIGQ